MPLDDVGQLLAGKICKSSLQSSVLYKVHLLEKVFIHRAGGLKQIDHPKEVHPPGHKQIRDLLDGDYTDSRYFDSSV